MHTPSAAQPQCANLLALSFRMTAKIDDGIRMPASTSDLRIALSLEKILAQKHSPHCVVPHV